MQVQLLNLLKVILFECKFSGNIENTKKVLTASSFTDTMVSGLKNQVAYVRQHFIDFVVVLIPMMRKLLEETDITDCVKEIVQCLISLLRKVDLSIY